MVNCELVYSKMTAMITSGIVLCCLQKLIITTNINERENYNER